MDRPVACHISLEPLQATCGLRFVAQSRRQVRPLTPRNMANTPIESTPAFTVSYAGEPFGVNTDRIGTVLDKSGGSEPIWVVPVILPWEGADYEDVYRLVELAITTGAIAVPDGLTLEVINSEDEKGQSFYVLVSNTYDRKQLLTNGWNDVDSVAVAQDEDADEPPQQSLDAITHALQYVVACANQALGLGWTYPTPDSDPS
jgi:hypothetical protein